MSQDASEVYSRLLLPKRHGYPLWVPEPHDNLPVDYQVTIGDVGTITTDGGFDPLFNICASLNDPVNSDGVPLPFEHVVLGPRDIRTWNNFHIPGTGIVSTSIQNTITSIDLLPQDHTIITPSHASCPCFRFTCSSSEGAILLLPDGACRRDLVKKRKDFREHAICNALRWYRFANEEQGREIPNGSLILVTGCDMAVSWGIASLSGPCGSNGVELNFVPSHGIDMDTSTITYSWQTNCSAIVRAGPKHRISRPIMALSTRSVGQAQTLPGEERQDVPLSSISGTFSNSRFVDSSYSSFNDVGRDQINITYRFGEQLGDVPRVRRGPVNTRHEDPEISELPGEQTISTGIQLAPAAPESHGSNQNSVYNQCVFLRGFRISIREGLAAALKGSTKTSEIVDARPQDFFGSTSQSIPFTRGASSRFWFRNMSDRSGSSGQQQQSEQLQNLPCEAPEETAIPDAFVEQLPAISQVYHPALVINEFLLDAFPQVPVAVTHDDDWIGVISESETTFPTKEDLIERICRQYTAKVESGAVFLEHSPPSQFMDSAHPSQETPASEDDAAADEMFNSPDRSFFLQQSAEWASPGHDGSTNKGDVSDVVGVGSSGSRRIQFKENNNLESDHSVMKTARKGAVRAKSGCYTCRLRRKKCDEKPNIEGHCETCVRLRIECLGFGTKRPEWLRDNRRVLVIRDRIKNHLAAQGVTKEHSGVGPENAEREPSMFRFGLHDDYLSSTSSAGPATPTLSLSSSDVTSQ